MNTKNTEILKREIVDSIIKYIKENGHKLSDDFYYWNTYPVVILDICVSYVVVNNGRLEFGDFPALKNDKSEYIGDDIKIELFCCRKTEDDISSLKADREYLLNTFKAMKITDGKKLTKQWI